MLQLVKRYQSMVRNNLNMVSVADPDTVEYWQNSLFASILTVLVPLSLIAILPGIIYSLSVNLPVIALFNTLVFSALVYMSLSKQLAVNYRKQLFLWCVYFAAIYLLIFVDINGPGLLFLYAACVLGVLIMPARMANWWSWINTIICVLFAGVLYFDIRPAYVADSVDPLQWVIVSTNLVFLSFLTSGLIPLILKGLATSVSKQVELNKELNKNQEKLNKALIDLEIKNKDLEQFSYLISHDLKEPLRMVSSFVGMIEQKYADSFDEKGKQYIAFALDGSHRMRKMIDDLLEFARLGSKFGTPEKVDLREMVEALAMSFKQDGQYSDAEFVIGPLPTIYGHRTLLTEIFQNLIGNALKYSKAEVPVVVEINAVDLKHEWEFSVKDNGIGIDPVNFEKIFKIFQRLHSGNDYQGTGIGLAVVKKIIQSLGGDIRVASAVGKGSNFIFTLPKN